jgi:signal peptidase I
MRRIAGFGLLVLVAGLAAVAFSAAAVPALTGTQAITIDRNSMQAELPMGSVAYIQAQDAYAVGDVVTFRSNGQVVTHAILAYLPNPANGQLDGLWLQTQGSSNPEPDPIPLNRDQILGRVIASIPVMGIALKTLGTPVVQVFLVLLAIGLHLLSQWPREKELDLTPTIA